VAPIGKSVAGGVGGMAMHICRNRVKVNVSC